MLILCILLATSSRVFGIELQRPDLCESWRPVNCNNLKCAKMSDVCNGRDDCGDLTDEDPVECFTKKPNIRLMWGKDKFSGRVQIEIFGVWGFIGSDEYDNKNARVICGYLGFYGPAKGYEMPYSGSDWDHVWLDMLHCKGNEPDISQCPRSPYGNAYNKKVEPLGVTCSYPTYSDE